jgi:TonB family protein
MLLPAGHEPSLTRRRRVAVAIGLSLAVHLVALLVFLAVGVGPAGGPGGGDPDPTEYVMVTGEIDPLAAGGADPLRPADTPLAPAGATPAASPSAGAAPAAERRRAGPRRPRPAGPAPASASLPAPAARSEPPAERRVDPAAEAARTAFRAELRRRMRETWRYHEVYQRIDPEKRLQGSLFTSVVEMRLRPDGKIEHAELFSSSGVEALDQLALASLTKMKPLPPVPPHMLDEKGGLTVNCTFHLDVGMFVFAARIRQAIEGLWRPSRSYAASDDQMERITLLRLLVERNGKLVSTNVVTSAGIDFLDENARRPLEPGIVLPIPPPAFTRQPGPAQVFLKFLHKSGQVVVVLPREAIEEE